MPREGTCGMGRSSRMLRGFGRRRILLPPHGMGRDEFSCGRIRMTPWLCGDCLPLLLRGGVGRRSTRIAHPPMGHAEGQALTTGYTEGPGATFLRLTGNFRFALRQSAIL